MRLSSLWQQSLLNSCHLQSWVLVCFSLFQRFTQFYTWESMTHRVCIHRLVVIWWNYLCRQPSCQQAIRRHRPWINSLIVDLTTTLQPKKSSCSFWRLSGRLNKYSVQSSVSSLLQKWFKLTRKPCRNCNCLSTNLKPNSMKKTSRSWICCSVNLSSRLYTSRLTRTSLMKRSENLKEQPKVSRSSSPSPRTKNVTWRKMMTSRDLDSSVCKIPNLTSSTISREKFRTNVSDTDLDKHR